MDPATALAHNKVAIYRQLINENLPVLEWRYEQRREMQEILPSIFLGPYSATRNLEELQRAGITHIVSLWDCSESKILKVHHPDRFKYLQLEISDAATQNLITLFPQVKQFIDQAILREDGKVLVNCMSGISRSPAFVVAYLMEATGMDYDIVYRYVQNKRFCMNPNPGFRHQLEVREASLTFGRRNKRLFNVSQSSPTLLSSAQLLTLFVHLFFCRYCRNMDPFTRRFRHWERRQLSIGRRLDGQLQKTTRLMTRKDILYY